MQFLPHSISAGSSIQVIVDDMCRCYCLGFGFLLHWFLNEIFCLFQTALSLKHVHILDLN